MSARNWCGGAGPQYKMPYLDGAAGASITTDGAGAAAWSDGLAGQEIHFGSSQLPAATSTTISTTMEADTRVYGVIVIPHGVGGAGDTLTILKNGVAITNAVSLNGSSDKTVLRETTLDYAQWDLAPGDALEVAAVNTTNIPALDVYIQVMAS